MFDVLQMKKQACEVNLIARKALVSLIFLIMANIPRHGFAKNLQLFIYDFEFDPGFAHIEPNYGEILSIETQKILYSFPEIKASTRVNLESQLKKEKEKYLLGCNDNVCVRQIIENFGISDAVFGKINKIGKGKNGSGYQIYITVTNDNTVKRSESIIVNQPFKIQGCVLQLNDLLTSLFQDEGYVYKPRKLSEPFQSPISPIHVSPKIAITDNVALSEKKKVIRNGKNHGKLSLSIASSNSIAVLKKPQPKTAIIKNQKGFSKFENASKLYEASSSGYTLNSGNNTYKINDIKDWFIRNYKFIFWGICILFFMIFLIARSNRINKFRQLLLLPLDSDSNFSKAMIIKNVKKNVKKNENGDILLGSAVTLGDALFETTKINPDVLDAIDTAHGSKAFDSYNDLLRHIENNSDTNSFQGMLSQYKGYYGEHELARQLIEQGHDVQLPDIPNQKGWDAIVDGQEVQFKSGLTSGIIDKHLEQYPDIPVITTAEHADKFADNPMVIALPDVTAENIHNTTEQTLHSLDSIADVSDLGAVDFPVVTIIWSTIKNIKSVVKGNKDIGTAGKHIGLDAAGSGLGAVGGGKLGAIIGGILGGPFGIAIGGLAGGIFGVIAGRKLTNSIKEKPLKKAQEDFNALLSQYPEVYVHSLRKKERSLYQRAHQYSPSFIRLIWPSFETVARLEVSSRYSKKADTCSEYCKAILSKLYKGSEDKHKIGMDILRDTTREAIFSIDLLNLERNIAFAYENVTIEMNRLR